MTNDTPSPSTEPDDDLLASLYLDGAATPEERARVESSPELMARVEQFAAIAGQLAHVDPPTELRDQHIANALDLFDQQRFDQQAAAAGVAPVTSLGSGRRARASRGLPTWLGAAAATVLVVGGLGFAATQLGGDDDEAATADMATDEVSASGANRALTTTTAPEGLGSDDAAESLAETEMAEAEMADADAGDDAAMAEESADEAMEEEEATEEEGAEEGEEEAGDIGAPDTTLAPIPLDDLEATTATGFYELLLDQPLLPISDSPCADSPLVLGLSEVVGHLPVVFDGQFASLVVQGDPPSGPFTAVIVGPTCNVELE